MTDNEIVKALETCGEIKYSCGICPYIEKHGGVNCNDALCLDALDLINRQKAEIEQWKEEANKYQSLWCEAVNDTQRAKSEAIKEFAERLKENSNDIVLYGEIIPICRVERLLKEMTE